MKLNHEPLGKYINEVNNRDSDMNVSLLLGVSLHKQFMVSIANTIGTDMSTYKIVKKNQFAYGPVTSRNGDKISIALLDKYNEAIVSQMYTVFDVVDKSKLLPEYLMMWFRRPEFDRYARFMSHGSAREIFSWEELSNVELPIPHIDKQKEIINEYDVLTNRIALNQKLIQNLNETAMTIYRHWFVDFEFPNKNGKPYKSSGGKMVYHKDIDQEIPDGWLSGNLSNIYSFQYGKGNSNPNNGGQYPVYGSNGIIGWYDKHNSEDAPVIGHIGENCGSVVYAHGKHFVTYNGVICSVITGVDKYFGYCTLLAKDLSSQTRGSSQPFVSYDMLYEIKAVVPDDEIMELAGKIFSGVFRYLSVKTNEKIKLLQAKDVLLSKMASIDEMSL